MRRKTKNAWFLEFLYGRRSRTAPSTVAVTIAENRKSILRFQDTFTKRVHEARVRGTGKKAFFYC